MASSLDAIILARSEETLLPNGKQGRIITLSNVAAIAEEQSIPGHVVESKALGQSIFPLRYLRNMNSVTADDQSRLLDASIAQVGLGGLGGNLLEIFLRMGVGTLRAADGDNFETSNLNRQALSTIHNLDSPKAAAAHERASVINPSIAFTASNSYLTAQDLPHFLDGVDLAVDALGGLAMRKSLQDAAAKAGIPLVTGAIAGWTGYVAVVMPGETGPADIMGQNNAAEEKLGCPSPAVTFIASLMALEACKIITNQSSELTGKILIIDLKTLSFDTIAI